MERAIYESFCKDSIEFTAKEAMYAMDSTNPLQLYDCLAPEITAFRPLRILTEEQGERNNIARLKLKETELAIVSSRLLLLPSLATNAPFTKLIVLKVQ